MHSTHSLVMEKTSVNGPLPLSPAVKSFTPKSPMPKSPMPKSPMPKSPVPYERYKSRCAYSLLSLFRFRQSHSKKLISNRKHLNKHSFDSQHARKRRDLLSNIDEECQCINDGVDQNSAAGYSCNAEVKKIPGEGISIENAIKRKNASAKVQHVKSDTEHVGDPSRNHKKANRTSRRHRHLPIYGCYDISTAGHQKSSHQDLMDGSIKNLDSAAKAKARFNHNDPKVGKGCNFETISSVRCDQLNEINLQLRLNEAAEEFINQKLVDGKYLNEDGASCESKHFFEALEILNSNKDLFIKLLQDPNSLLVKHIEDLRDSQSKKQQNKTLLEAELIDDRTSNTTRSENFKSIDSDQSRGSRHPQSLETIVVLRTGVTNSRNSVDRISNDSSRVHYSLRTVQQSVKPTIFQFEQMKRKLMRAMGVGRKEQPLLTDGAVHGRANNVLGNSLSSSDAAKKNVHMEKMKKFESGSGEETASSSASSHEDMPKKSKYEKFVETRVHFSELNNGNANSLRTRRPKTWDGISSFPDYDFLPMGSPRRKKEAGLFTPQMRFCPYDNRKTGSANWRNRREEKNRCLSPSSLSIDTATWAGNKKLSQLHIFDTECNNSDELFPDIEFHESISSFNTDLSPRETKDGKNSVEISPSGTSEAGGSHDNGVTAGECKINGPADFSELDSHVENQTFTSSTAYDYSSSPSSIQKVADFNSTNNVEQPSPVSVLDQFSMEDVTSPLSAEFGRDNQSILPIKIGIEDDHVTSLLDSLLDLKINSSTSLEDHGSPIEYLTAVLQTSGLNWDELSLKCRSSDQILDQSFFAETNMQSDHTCVDRSLISAYANELLLEIYHCHFRCSPWVSFVKPRAQLITVAETPVHEVMKRVDWNLFSDQHQRTMDQLVENDLNKPGTWLDLRIDTEDIVSEMVESILEELAHDAAME